MRVFAGPNGSGKTTIIEAIRNYRIKGIPLDFGIYINADDIAYALRNDDFIFTTYGITTTRREFNSIALASGLINEEFNATEFNNEYGLTNNVVKLKHKNRDERMAQIIAHFLRKKLLQKKKKFSFETVFSHPSKLDIMKEAIEAGYKVYLYFVSTEDPEINKFRVGVRTKLQGHNVDPQKIVNRYYRTLDLLYDAAQLAYQAYFFDNSKDGSNFKFFAHFKRTQSKIKWDEIDNKKIPKWFIKYYYDKAIDK